MVTEKKKLIAKSPRTSSAAQGRKGIQSVEVGMRVVDALAGAAQALPLGEVGRLAGISPSQAHRYLTSFAKSGLVYQDAASGRYGLGPQALRWGISAMTKTDFVEVSAHALDALCERLDLTGLLCVWGDRGPTCVRMRRSKLLLGTDLGLGSVFPVLTSATGHVFLAYLAESMTADFVKAEAEAASRQGRTADTRAIESMCHQVRATGLAQELSHYVDRVSAMAAPVFDYQGDVTAVITLLFRGLPGGSATQGPLAEELTATTTLVSRALGWTGADSPQPA